MRKRVVIIGCGFAGLSAAGRLHAAQGELDVTMVDRYRHMHYRPLLPDAVSGIVPRRDLLAPIGPYARRYGFRFIHGEAEEVLLQDSRVRIGDDTHPYDYLILATGSETNFFGNENLRTEALKLDEVPDVEKLSGALSSGGYERIVVAGGGYTGVETATHIRRFFHTRGVVREIVVVEMLDSLVAALPRWMRRYTAENLDRLGVQAALGEKVEAVDGRTISLASGRSFENALLVWTAGMRAANITRTLDAPKAAQKRLVVDDYLRIADNAWAVGNSACYDASGGCGRMSAQGAVAQGDHAARTIVRLSRGEALVPFRTVDWGYLVPMANWRSCGNLFGINVSGNAATFLHYLINAWRSRSVQAKAAVLLHGLAGSRGMESRYPA